MKNEEKQPEKQSVGEMRKRREKMADDERYIVYYTFGDEGTAAPNEEVRENV